MRIWIFLLSIALIFNVHFTRVKSLTYLLKSKKYFIKEYSKFNQTPLTDCEREKVFQYLQILEGTRYKDGGSSSSEGLDCSGLIVYGDFVHMLGIGFENEKFYDLMRLYLVAHCDHEGGNVSALTTQTINSALSDLYYSLSGGFNGLAGPLHGLANQESLKWILKLMEKYNGTPTKEQLKDYVWETLDAGKVIPGYGHSVLRVTDPRFEAFSDFGKKHFPDDPVFLTVSRLFEVVPEELKKIEKIQNPWPNVDAASGSMLYHFGLKEFSYYTVVFAVSRSLGLSAQAVINRAMLKPLIRPKSVTTEYVNEVAES